MIQKSKGNRGRWGSGGFSAVELMVTLVVFGVMAAASIPAFSKSMTANKLVSASDGVRSKMRLARSRAVAENRPYIIAWYAQYGQVFLVRDENLNGQPDWGSEYQEGPLTMPNGIKMTNYGSNPFPNSYVVFNPDGSASASGALLIVNTQGQQKVVNLIQPSGTVTVSSPEEYSAQFPSN
jgi:prepilin-type N-terminal cleavage/methylation domain-containing protein